MEDDLKCEYYTKLTPQYLEEVAEIKRKCREQKLKRENEAKQPVTGKQ